MRTGREQMNIGVPQPNADWQLGHLYQPRAYLHGIIMPSYRFLFERKDKPETGDVKVTLPPGYVPDGKLVIASKEVLDLICCLKSLNRSYPVLAAPAWTVSGAKP